MQQFGMIISTVLLTVGAIWFSSVYNAVKKLKVGVDGAFATMDIYLEKRYDIIPNIENVINTVSPDAEEAFAKVLEARDAAWNANSWQERFAGENEITAELDKFWEASESYQALQSNKNFVKYRQQLKDTAEDIEHARNHYNIAAKEYNAKIRSFPAFLYAKMLKYKKRPLFNV